MSKNAKKLTLLAFVMMMVTSMFGASNIAIGYLRMGYAAIPMFVMGGLLFFIPYMLMTIEMATGFRGRQGGIFTWMKDSVNTKFAFVGIMMWYAAYIIWLFARCFSFWVPLSFTLFDTDITVYTITTNFQLLAPGSQEQIDYLAAGSIDLTPVIMGFIGIALFLAVSWLISKGPSKLAKITTIGGLGVMSLTFILLIGGIIAALVTGEFQQEITMQAFVQSPNPDYQSVMPFLGFFVFAIFAYGGLEAIAGIADDLENPDRDLKRGIFMAAAFIIGGYVLGFFMTGAAVNHEDLGNAGSMSVTYYLFQLLGDTISNQDGSMLGYILMKYAAFSSFLAGFGAFVALGYGPLKQLIEGTPKEFWPESYQVENSAGIKVGAIKFQAMVVIIFLSLKTILALIYPEGAAALYELLITMMNVSMTIPYLFIIYAWYRFRHDDNLNKDIIFIKNKSTVMAVFIISSIAVAFGNIFSIIDPFISGNSMIGIEIIAGPVTFCILAFIIYHKKGQHIKD